MSDQNGSDADSLANKPPVPPRDDLVNTAAKFLSAPNVQRSPNDMKIAFLKKKGLSDVEIDLAFKKCEASLQSRALEVVPQFAPPQYQHVAPVSWYQYPRWLTFRDIMNTIMIIAGVVYGLYWIYKKYVWNYLFGGIGKKKSADERLNDIESNLSAVGKGMEALKESVDMKGPLAKEISYLKSEVSSIKKILVGRKQFPSPGSAPLSIPSWQIAAAAATSGVDEKEEEGTATNGSNGSDSSLEMIKE